MKNLKNYSENELYCDSCASTAVYSRYSETSLSNDLSARASRLYNFIVRIVSQIERHPAPAAKAAMIRYALLKQSDPRQDPWGSS